MFTVKYLKEKEYIRNENCPHLSSEEYTLVQVCEAWIKMLKCDSTGFWNARRQKLIFAGANIRAKQKYSVNISLDTILEISLVGTENVLGSILGEDIGWENKKHKKDKLRHRYLDRHI